MGLNGDPTKHAILGVVTGTIFFNEVKAAIPFFDRPFLLRFPVFMGAEHMVAALKASHVLKDVVNAFLDGANLP